MSNKLHIPVVLGTGRAGRMSEPVARYVTSVLQEREDVSTELVDVRDHVQTAITIPPWSDQGANNVGSVWKNIVQKSSALILIVPEYNHGYPGELKILLDSLWEDYKGRPVAMVGVSKGTLGGARVLDHIKPILVELHLHPIRESVSFSKVEEAFNDDGSIKNEKTTEYVNKVVNELVSTAQALAPLRK